MMIDYLVQPGGSLTGEFTVPGDKSISHRSVILGSLADGVTEVSGLLEGLDVLATIHAFRQMGVQIEGPDQGRLIIHGNGLKGLRSPSQTLDLGNSGTSIRLLTGLLSAQNFDSVLTGDESLCKRPMRRVTTPLSELGAEIQTTQAGTAPIQIKAVNALQGGEFALTIASAQIKSALLLAGIFAETPVTVIEPVKTRDHTERMLRGMGCQLEIQDLAVTLIPPTSLEAQAINVPGDISSAAFYMVGASIAQDSQVLIKNVGINPTRTGVIEILQLMGAKIELLNQRQSTGEPVADIKVTSANLTGIEVPQHLIASAIDEFPVLMVAAACAEGKTVVKGAAELRVKESDRIASMVSGLTRLGIEVEELEDGMIVTGGRFQGGEVDSYDDHRISMAFAMAGLATEQPIKVNDCRNVATSFPDFDTLAIDAGLRLQVQS